MSIVECKNVVKIYGAGQVQVKALRGVDLIIEKGEFAAIAGPSGSGKSTLLNIIGALDIPTEGSVRVAGQELAAMNPVALSRLRRDNIGFIFQAYNLIPVLTALENVEFIMMIQGQDKAHRLERAKDMLELVGLSDMMHRRPNELSGGQQQRVAVARAIVSRPQLILADEPTANLDSKTGSDLIDLMYQLNQQEQMTFIFSSHDKMVIERSRRLLVLRDGLIIEDKRQNGAQ